MKPTLAPFALAGIRERRWWVAAAVLGVVSLAFLPMWPDYVTVLGNVQSEGWFYLFGNVPIMVAALVIRR